MDSGGSSQAIAHALSRRASLRQATVILPQTGERARRKITLRNANLFAEQTRGSNASHNECSPLLPTNGTLSTQNKGTTTWKERSVTTIHTAVAQSWAFLCSRNGKNVIKCSVAYFLASLAVFISWFTGILGTGDGKHLVANIVVWYNPARSAGSMNTGTLLACAAFLYAALVCYSSMATITLFASLNLLALGHAVILILFCGVALGLLGWLKQRYNDFLVNVSVSLASIPIVTMSTKEPAIHQGFISHAVVTQTLRMAVMAILISTLVNIFVWPIRARNDLRENLVKATNGFSEILGSITTSFLSGSKDDLKESEKMNTALGALPANLAEARNEHYLLGSEREFHIEERLVKCIQRLAQDVGALRSAASTQFALLEESEASAKARGDNDASRKPTNDQSRQKDIGISTSVEVPTLPRTVATDFGASRNQGQVPVSLQGLSSMPDSSPAPVQSLLEQRRTRSTETASDDSSIASDLDATELDVRGRSLSSESISAASAAETFATFIEHLGPPMKSLAFTLKQILNELPFGPGPAFVISTHPAFRSSLSDAVKLFTRSRREALQLVYQTKAMSLARSLEVAADFEEVAASCGHFSSSLQHLAENCLTYLDILDEFEEEVNERSRGRTWWWLAFWRGQTDKKADERAGAPLVQEFASLPGNAASIPTQKLKIVPTERSAMQLTFRYRLWAALRMFRRDDIRYSIKIGIGVTLLATLAFLPSTQPLFFQWRLEWALATYMFVCSMTIGAANTTTISRLIGTGIGAVVAIVVWVIADDNAYLLAFLGWVVSVCCFYIIIVRNQGPMGRFILLTYNLSVLYSYSLSVNDEDDDDDEGGINPQIFEIVLHRVIAIVLGCLYGLFITRAVWPISARKKLKAGLSLLWLRMSLIWKRAPLSVFLNAEKPPAYMDIKEEMRLREFADLLETMRTNAESEFVLRGPFPTERFDAILKSTNRMLDAIHALNVVIAKDLKATPGEAELLKYTTKEREQLARRISHLLSVLASSIKLEYPLNDVLPEIEHTRDRLLARIFAFRHDASKSAAASDEDYELLYAYVLVTGQIAKEIGCTGKEIEKVYGVLDEKLLKLQ